MYYAIDFNYICKLKCFENVSRQKKPEPQTYVLTTKKKKIIFYNNIHRLIRSLKLINKKPSNVSYYKSVLYTY